MEFLTDTTFIYITLAAVFGIFMAWGIGANDVANAMATSVGSKAITIKQAIIIAAIFEFLGAYLAGGQVTKTIRKGIVDLNAFDGNPDLLIWGMLASLLAAGTWLLIASMKGWPVSTTHSIVGAVIGFAAVGVSVDAVSWGKVGTIVMSWVVSPVLAGGIAFAVFKSIQNLVINTSNPLENAKKYGPFYLFMVGFIIALVTIKKGLKHIGLDVNGGMEFVYAIILGLLVALLGVYLIKKVKFDEKAEKRFHFANVEKIFAVLMVFTAAAMAFAHGSNDVANAVGPMAAVISVAQSGELASKSELPSWVLLVGAIGIVIGLATLGYKVMATVGKNITELTPTRGFSAEIGAASTVVLASYTGLPISTTQTLVGAILGVGLARGIAAIDLRVVGNIFMSWVITLPAGAILSILFFYMLKGIFG
ncbi:inorganic phosphate transporter [Cocleimonas flava]|uniref:Phosphate transporter n=1 Tax=Cocleimonas flava TaxID=634765 RepID=A0A4V2P9B9_9GAMM|nr:MULTISPECIES: inorganic phosphate transporter [Cocleimonas]MEB8431343.1 inorganic phosphate transporter [Cocleimonas sp. KMM 6892]MEC4713885.1 inorganic phosphate transporter [Cocleimonas sp. KMM 6895]MEC4743216.1 inorganic phosphate transporter [Cocleimonas sp. KMM 6896]TCJ89025.1 PiT family inorganic phosphate transporter [Cocleimonas flava]